MNISASSSALTLVYVFVLLWILMGVDIKALSRKKRWVSLGAIVLLCVYNEVLSAMIPSSTYVRLLFLNMHLPMFLLYLYIARRGVIKTGFMIMTALVFSSPPVIVGNILHNRFSVGILGVLISHIIVYLLMLLMAFFVFRSVFVYLLTYSNNSFFLLFNAFNHVMAGALRGQGDSRGPMIVMLASFVAIRQLYLLIVTRFVANTPFLVGFGYPVGWMCCFVLELIYYMRRGRLDDTRPDPA